MSALQTLLSSEGSKRKATTALSVGDDHVFLLTTTEDDDSSSDSNSKSVVKITKKSRPNPVFSSFTQGASLSPTQTSLLTNLSLSQTHSNAEYSSYDAASSRPYSLLSFLPAPLLALLPPPPPPPYSVEIISPASDKQVARATPNPPVMIRETPSFYSKYVEPYLAANATADSLGWVYNCVDVTKESERLLLNEEDFILNVDTKWKRHANCLTVPLRSWKDHPTTDLSDLYCLAICKARGIRTIRDLRGSLHLPLLRRILSLGTSAIADVYGVPGSQLRVFAHYIPQFYHFHVHFTRLHNDSGCQVERAHLLEDVIQNLEGDEEYYVKRTISYKLPVNDKLAVWIDERRRAEEEE